MKQYPLVLISEVDPDDVAEAKSPEELNRLRRSVYAGAKNFLQPYCLNGKGRIKYFEAADKAWRQQLYHPYGVVFGKTEPALFLYLFSQANSEMEMIVEQKLKKLADQAEGVIKGVLDDVSFAAISFDIDATADLYWHKNHAAGLLQSETRLYSLVHQTSRPNHEQQWEILKNTDGFALCVLDVLAE